MEQVREGRNGRMITITEDVANVAVDLKKIDPRLHLRYSEKGGYFVVYTREDHEPEGTGHMVGTYQELDQRIVKDIQETYWKWRQPGYSLADELDKMDEKAEKEADHQHYEQTGEAAERLAFALRKDLGQKDQIFVKGLPSE